MAHLLDEFEDALSRRRFCTLTAATATAMATDIPILVASPATVRDGEFVIVNGWVLNRTDLTGEGFDK